MTHKLIIPLKKYLLFPFLLPVFFVLHGVRENYGFVSFGDALLLTGIYWLATAALLLLFRFIFKNWAKAAIASFLFMTFHFFFGSIHDTVRDLFGETPLTRYVFLLPFFFVLLITAVILLKRRKKPPGPVIYYLNILLAVLILLDAGLLTGRMAGNEKNSLPGLQPEFSHCSDCSYPDVYVIITDEYAGNRELKEVFGFDNSPFLSALEQKGFHVIANSTSNYNYTVYSIASTLNMDYLDKTGKQPPLSFAYETIRNNRLLRFLQWHGYRFYNHTSFDFTGQPAQAEVSFLPSRTRLITSQTFLSRIEKELGYHLFSTLKWKSFIRKTVYSTGKNNEHLYRLTTGIAGSISTKPKFVLTHLMMPHYPYYFDASGKAYPFESLVEGNQSNKEHYLQYLQYCNKKLLSLTDHILKNAKQPPVIVLMGDHGFRHFAKPVDMKYHYDNLAAVYLPGSTDSSFKDDLTNVNLLRTVLNTAFRQQLPYLRDTTYIIKNQP